MDTKRAAALYPGALRLTTLHITAVNHLPAGSLPIRFSAPAAQRPLKVEKVVQESQDVQSFYLKAQKDDGKPLWKFSAGQHLPIRLHTPTGELLRSYSLSSTHDSFYRISVKRQGKASGFLHDHVLPGSTIMVQPPAGDFVLDTTNDDNKKRRPIVLLSAGIGVTPIFSMSQQAVSSQTERPVVWIQGARDGEHHVFADQVADLVQSAESSVDVQKHVVYSRPRKSDNTALYDSVGHVDVHLIQSLTSNWKDADYMCGLGAFQAGVQEDLLQAGVDLDRIHRESF